MTAASDRREPDLRKKVPVLVGPTASGKTTVSLLIAGPLNAEIISADSRQVYKRLDIGTAKPSMDERTRVRHFFVDEIEPRVDFNAGEYGIRGRQIIEDIQRRGKLPFIVGGSGLYIRALVDGFFEGASSDAETRVELYARLRKDGAQTLYDELKRVDPLSASAMLASNTRRVVRALEVFRVTGVPISELQRQPVRINFTPLFAGLRWGRQSLYRRIDERVDQMIERGLVEEVRALRADGFLPDLNSLNTPGYREVFAYLDGNCSVAEMVELIKRNSRRYAKRQLTWFRRDTRIQWFDIAEGEELSAVASRVQSFYQESMPDNRPRF